MLNTSIKVSIGIPVYNAEKYIERCVISILEQDYASIEVIFVDDASKDRSVDIIKQTLESFISRKESVRIIHHKTNQGVSVARNTFLDNQTGDFVMFVDADDYLMPGAISKLVVKQQEDNSDLAISLWIAVIRKYIQVRLTVTVHQKHCCTVVAPPLEGTTTLHDCFVQRC